MLLFQVQKTGSSIKQVESLAEQIKKQHIEGGDYLIVQIIDKTYHSAQISRGQVETLKKGVFPKDTGTIFDPNINPKLYKVVPNKSMVTLTMKDGRTINGTFVDFAGLAGSSSNDKSSGDLVILKGKNWMSTAVYLAQIASIDVSVKKNPFIK